MKFEITILGSGSSIPTLERGSSAQLVNFRESYFLIDCGEGTQLQMRKFNAPYSKINHIFISHLHGDHYLGLIGLISSMNLLGRTRDLYLYAAAELKPILDQHFKVSETWLNFTLHFIPLDHSGKQLIFENNYIQIFSFPTKHRIPCCGFLFVEKPRELRLNKEAIKEFTIPVGKMAAIKKGEDYITPEGKKVKNKLLTLPPESLYSYAYCSDTAYSKKVVEAIKNTHTVYHESTFLDNLIDRAKKTLHSTAKQAAKVAVEANVQKMFIGHFSIRYKNDKDFVAQAREVFEETYAVKDGDIIKLY